MAYVGNVTFSNLPIGTGIRSAFTSYYMSPVILPSSTAAAVLANRVYFQPIILANQVVDRIGIEVTTGAAGNCRLGLYTNSGGMPGSLILDCGTVDTTSIATVEASFTALTLPPAWVWMAAVFDATPTCRICSAVGCDILGASAVGTPSRSISASFTYGTLPSTATTPTAFTTQAAAVFLRKS